MCSVYAHTHTSHIPFGTIGEQDSECFPGVSSRQIWRQHSHKRTHTSTDTHIHTSHPSSKPQCWQAYLLNRTKPQSPSIYIPDASFLSTPFLSFFQFIFYLFTPTFNHWFSSRQLHMMWVYLCVCLGMYVSAAVCSFTTPMSNRESTFVWVCMYAHTCW